MFQLLAFQFHKGAIRTRIIAAGNTLGTFQFHKGAIRTLTLPLARFFKPISIP